MNFRSLVQWRQINYVTFFDRVVLLSSGSAVQSPDKELCTKNGPIVNYAVNPRHTVTFAERSGTGAWANRFSVAHIMLFSALPRASSVHKMFHDHSLSTSMRPRNSRSNKCLTRNEAARISWTWVILYG